MNLDIRTPMGLMFALLGAILTVYGAVTHSDPELYKKSLNININLWWGMVMLAFGLVMLGLAWRASKATPVAKVAEPENPRPRVGAGH